MTPALAGWIVLGAFCLAALVMMLLGVLPVLRAQRELKAKLARLEETQARALNPQRLGASIKRILRNAESAKELVERARRAISTIGVAMRYCVVAVRVVKLLR